MNEAMRKLAMIDLIEDLKMEGLSSNLIESIVQDSEDNLDVAFICSTKEELHNAIKLMSNNEDD